MVILNTNKRSESKCKSIFGKINIQNAYTLLFPEKNRAKMHVQITGKDSTNQLENGAN